jgi:phage pi2 protein 07
MNWVKHYIFEQIVKRWAPDSIQTKPVLIKLASVAKGGLIVYEDNNFFVWSHSLDDTKSLLTLR